MVEFEPRVIDEAEPSFMEIGQLASNAPRATRAGRPGNSAGTPWWNRELGRRFAGAARWFFALVFALLSVLVIRRNPRVQNLLLWPLLATMVLIVITYAQRQWQVWLLAPGCLIWRSSKGVRLFDARQSMLCVYRHPNQGLTMLVADGGGVGLRQVTRDEAQIILRAWLSPIAAPAADRLTDFA